MEQLVSFRLVSLELLCSARQTRTRNRPRYLDETSRSFAVVFLHRLRIHHHLHLLHHQNLDQKKLKIEHQKNDSCHGNYWMEELQILISVQMLEFYLLLDLHHNNDLLHVDILCYLLLRLGKF